MSEGIGKNGQRRKRVLWSIAAGLAIVVFATLAGFFYMDSREAKADPSAAQKEQSQKVIKQVSEIYQVPTDEDPAVALIQDKDKLKDQPFYASAENGDYVIIYSRAKVALLYREKDKRLINVERVDIGSEQDAGDKSTQKNTRDAGNNNQR